MEITMLTFKSPEDLNKLPDNHPAYATVGELIEQLITAYSPPGRLYDAEDDGYIILIEEGRDHRPLVHPVAGYGWTGNSRQVIYFS